MSTEQHIAYYSSPIGTLEIAGSEAGIMAIRFLDDAVTTTQQTNVHPCLQTCIEQLDAYFRGERREFSVSLQLDGTDFQQRVWAELLNIPFGTTKTYLEIAEKLGNHGAVRAVGTANGQNPISIIVPCHRVIGSKGELTGYAGGLWRKKWLLEHEGHPIQQRLFS